MSAPTLTPLVHLSNQASLAVVELAISSLIFAISSFSMVYKSTLRTDKTKTSAISAGYSGFAWLALLSLTHIVGSACYVSQEVNSLSSAWVLVYAITNFVAAAPLLLASLSFSQFTGATTTGGAGRAGLGLIQLLPAAGFAIGIAGGIEQSHASSHDATIGKELLEASAIIFLVTAAALVAITAVNLSFVRSLRTLAITVSMPFLAVRVIYNVLTAFSDDDTIYAFNLPDFSVQIFMRFVMEYAIVLLYLFTGLGALAAVESNDGKDSDTGTGTGSETGNELEAVHTGSSAQQNTSRTAAIPQAYLAPTGSNTRRRSLDIAPASQHQTHSEMEAEA